LLEDGGSDITTLGGLWNLLGRGSLNESPTTALNNAGLLSGIVSSLGGLVTTGQLEAALDNVSLGTLLGGDTTNITGLLNDALNLGDLLNYLGLSSVELTDLPSIVDLGDLSPDSGRPAGRSRSGRFGQHQRGPARRPDH
jgi:hypothetical protein